MPKAPKKLTAQAKKDLERVHRFLLSGNEKHYRSARKLIRQYKKEELVSFDALDLLDGIKRWIENSDMEVKSIKFLEDIVGRAKDPSFLVAEDWYVTAVSARALRYGGRFNLARRRYNKAIEKMGELGEVDQKKSEVLADYAEFWAYLGYTDNAMAILSRIPGEAKESWVSWVKAFVLHQAAFTSQFPIGSPVAKPVGDIALYLQSNYALARARTTLEAKEKADSYLLEAANWGGIYHRLKADGAPPSEQEAARAEAKCALAGFQDGPLVNKFWTWQKERRGMMVRRWVRNIDEPWLGKGDVKAWRQSLTEHFWQNLKAAGLPLKLDAPPPDPVHADGETGSESDPGDDD